MLYNNEIIGGLESIGFGGYRIFGPQAVQYLDYYCGSGSAVTIETNNEPFCCDINAINFGQTANGQPYGTNPGEPEQYLMINGPQGDMCDNSICQGNVNEPESIGDPPFDDNITNITNAHYNHRYGWHLKNYQVPQKSVEKKDSNIKGNV